jgi:hypothetical protein
MLMGVPGSDPGRRSSRLYNRTVSHSSELVDLTGQTFGRWRVLERIPGQRGRTSYRCRCACGNEKVVRHDNLRSGASRSCGCLQRKPAREASKGDEPGLGHGHPRRAHTTREYSAWIAMLKRCLNPRAPGYSYYGGLCITVCERWLRFENFLEDMRPCPDEHTLHRIVNNRDFEPGNCRWAQPGSTRRQIPQIPLGGRDPRGGAAVSTCTREQRVAVAQRLRPQGLTLREIGGVLGVAPNTVGDWLNDPDGSRLKERKESYRGTCVDCGGPTTGGLGRGAHAPLRCHRCWGKATAERRQRALDRFELIARLWAEGKTSREIEAIVGDWTSHPGGLISSMRSRGYDLPYHYDPARVPNMQRAARENLRKARSALASRRAKARQ